MQDLTTPGVPNELAHLYVMKPSEQDSSLGAHPAPSDGLRERGILTSSSPILLNDDDEVDEPKWDWMRDRQKQVKMAGLTPITFLPLLGCEGYIRINRTHLMSAYPKGGKTELLVNALLEWDEEKILYLSEEARETWDDRRYELPDWPNEMKTVYALGMSQAALLDEMRAWDGSVVVIDTVKLIGIEDENDNSKVQKALTPFIEVARQRKQTLIFVHHDNKHGGKGGKGIAGASAFVGIVDIFLELDEVANEPDQRKLTGRGRIRSIEPLIFERDPKTGLMRAITGGEQSGLIRVYTALSSEWKSSAELQEHTELSEATVRRHLKKLLGQGKVEPSDTGRGKVILWRRANG